MNAVRKVIVVLVGLALGIGTSVVVCIKGWGLEPKSWGWIIGAYLIGQMMAHMFVEIGKRDDE
jgi:hypothetical protein